MPQNEGAAAFLQAFRNPGNTLRARYEDDPLGLAERLGVMLPRKPVQKMISLGVITEEEAEKKYGKLTPGLRELVYDICSGDVTDAVGVASRGGGKSKGASFIEFYLWLFKHYDILNLGGSELQADQVYRYVLDYLEQDDEYKRLLKGDPQRERSYSIENAWIRVLAASQKSVRSPHAGGLRAGRVRGGLLVIDEEAETEPDIVDAALATVNTAEPSVNLRISTFHNLEGSFQTVVDNHEEMGYQLYHWCAFDICKPCDCVSECENEEPCFREDHYEEFVDPDTGETSKKLVHSAYCGGRSKYAEGWMPQAEIVKIWRRMGRNHSRFEVEMMGSRPSTAGHVCKDLTKFGQNVIAEPASTFYLSGGPISICVDWGFNAAGVQVWQAHAGGKHVLLESELVIENNQTQIFGIILGFAAKYHRDLEEVACDIGGGGNYLNRALEEDHRLPVRGVNFNESKEAAVAAFNIFNENGKLVVPSEHNDFITQIRGWRRIKGRIAKGNDHLCDASVCYFSKFIDELGVSGIRVPPRAFRSGLVKHNEEPQRTPGASVAVRVSGKRGALPLARTFRGKR